MQRIISKRVDGIQSAGSVHGWIWLAVSIVLAATPFTDAFIPSDSSAESRLLGWAYYAYIATALALYCLVFKNAFESVKRL
ncbi:MAG TPA: hypothetical protein VL069_14345, partial [Opitutus sp.]|nr:hypothetical protein [Opitutus sp.]